MHADGSRKRTLVHLMSLHACLCASSTLCHFMPVSVQNPAGWVQYKANGMTKAYQRCVHMLIFSPCAHSSFACQWPIRPITDSVACQVPFLGGIKVDQGQRQNSQTQSDAAAFGLDAPREGRISKVSGSEPRLPPWRARPSPGSPGAQGDCSEADPGAESRAEPRA